jgi:small-conductance mechanosensitive channel
VLRLTRRCADEPWKYARIHMLSRLLRYCVWVVGTLVGLYCLGIDLTSIALLGSALAVGLGFGHQNVFGNFVSGEIILLERSLKVGDFVELESGVRGHVREIAMRYTRVTSNDSLDVLLPNSEFINGRVVNWTLDDAYRRMHIPFDVAYGTDKEQVCEASIAAARTAPGVIEADCMRSTVWLVGYGDSAVNFGLMVWADRALTTRPASTHAALMWALDDELKRRAIEIPFPQRDLHVRSGTLDVRLQASVPPQPTPSARWGSSRPCRMHMPLRQWS